MTRPSFPLRGPVVMGILTLTLLLGGFGAWAAISRISGAVIASGQIEVERNRQAVQHPDGGVVAELSVDEGDTVARNEVLLRLDPTLLRSQLVVAEDQYHEVLARRGRLEAERDSLSEPVFPDLLTDKAAGDPEIADLVEGQTRLFHARRESLAREAEQMRKQAEQIAVQISGIEAQQAALEQQLTLIEEELANQQSLLEKGLAQASRVLALKRQKAQLAGQSGELTAQSARARGRIAEIDVAILSLQSQLREQAITELRDLQVRERELAEEINSLRDRLGRMDIRAPVSGVVYGLSVFGRNAVVRPAEPLMYLVPQDRALVIAARVAPINIDELSIGQDVLLRFISLDQRNTPEITGNVTSLSADAFVDDATQQSYYRAEITMRPDEIDKLPDGTRLIPGMPVEAFVQTGERSPIAYLMKPLADYFAHAFRES